MTRTKSRNAVPRFQWKTVPAELRKGLAAVAADHPDRLGAGRQAWNLTFQRDNALGSDAYAIEGGAGSVGIRYGSVSGAFRALGRLLAEDGAALAKLKLR